MATRKPTDRQFTGSSSRYQTNKQVAKIVNLAIRLGRPLLVEGEPGCGKTKLADAVAEELGLGDPVKISVKSTSRAQDLLWRYNALSRLQDAQRNVRNAKYVHPYISLGPLGAAIERKQRCVVLIDEIDKADIDFPNDLLDVLDEFEFTIDELPQDEAKHRPREVKGSEDLAKRPIVIITSNREKHLPEPLLRRCLFVRLEFPKTAAELRTIVEKNLDKEKIAKDLIDAAASRLLEIRAVTGDRIGKQPSTSELLDWVRILSWEKKSADEIAKAELADLPLWQTLYKTARDLEAYEAAAKKSR